VGRDETRGLEALEVMLVEAGTLSSDWLSTVGTAVDLAREMGTVMILVTNVVTARALVVEPAWVIVTVEGTDK